MARCLEHMLSRLSEAKCKMISSWHLDIFLQMLFNTCTAFLPFTTSMWVPCALVGVLLLWTSRLHLCLMSKNDQMVNDWLSFLFARQDLLVSTQIWPRSTKSNNVWLGGRTHTQILQWLIVVDSRSGYTDPIWVHLTLLSPRLLESVRCQFRNPLPERVDPRGSEFA